MSSYAYTAVDGNGVEARGTLAVGDPLEAVRRIKEMGLFPTRVMEVRPGRPVPGAQRATLMRQPRPWRSARVGAPALAVFTRQLATLINAGMPLLRGLRTLRQQQENPALKKVIVQVSDAIESGQSLADALEAHPKVFNPLYVNMVKAGELSGALDVTLRRLAEFMEKSQAIRRKVMAAMFYPSAVIVVAVAILTLLMTYVVPRFKGVFEGLLNNASLPAFTLFVFNLSEAVRHHAPWIALGIVAVTVGLTFLGRTVGGRWVLDQVKLAVPVVGPLFRKAALGRFTRILGTLLGNGVPILQALTIARETSGNAVFARVIARIHEQVKQGEPIAPTLRTSRVFPAMVAGMVDVGEQTGALPDMLVKVAEECDAEVDSAATALTSLLEPVLIVFLAIVVGSIVIAMFLPLIEVTRNGFSGPGEE